MWHTRQGTGRDADGARWRGDDDDDDAEDGTRDDMRDDMVDLQLRKPTDTTSARMSAHVCPQHIARDVRADHFRWYHARAARHKRSGTGRFEPARGGQAERGRGRGPRPT